jgi:dethiobiotin synthetase
MKKNIFFITGTDTDVGKTYVSDLLLHAILKAGKSTLGFKPISAGCEQTPDGLRNEDALVLKAASSINAQYEHVNPIAFAPPIAPHIAAEQVGQSIDLGALQTHYETIQRYQADVLLIEGAGGWRLPLNRKGTYLSDFVLQNQLPVILVVGMRLGCLNHAILTLQSIQRDGLQCVGWIANQLSDDMPVYEDNLATLREIMPAPLIAHVPYMPSIKKTDKASAMHQLEGFAEVFAL